MFRLPYNLQGTRRAVNHNHTVNAVLPSLQMSIRIIGIWSDFDLNAQLHGIHIHVSLRFLEVLVAELNARG